MPAPDAPRSHAPPPPEPGSPDTPSWGAEALWEALNPLMPGLSIEVVDSLDSTNAALITRVRASAQRGASAGTRVYRSAESRAFGRRSTDFSPCLLVAEQQTAGRGRLGRTWVSRRGDSLTFSLALSLKTPQLDGLSLVVGCAVADALDPPTSPPKIWLKWPNDLCLSPAPAQEGPDNTAEHIGPKLGGVLIETVTAGSQRWIVIGVGLNLSAPTWDAQVLQSQACGVAGWRDLEPSATPAQLLHRVAQPLVEALMRFESEGLGPFMASFDRRDALKGKAVCPIRGTGAPNFAQGQACGIDERGAIKILTPQGIETVESGEISLRTTKP